MVVDNLRPMLVLLLGIVLILCFIFIVQIFYVLDKTNQTVHYLTKYVFYNLKYTWIEEILDVLFFYF